MPESDFKRLVVNLASWQKSVGGGLARTERIKKPDGVGPPEVDWARDYERSLIPAGTRFPKKGDVYEATRDVEVSYLTSWSAPFTGGGLGAQERGT